MPRTGFISITVRESIYDNFMDVYQKSKEELKNKGITTFTGYITHLMNESIHSSEVSKKYKMRFEKMSIDTSRVVLKDNYLNRICEVNLKKLFCELCQKNSCPHIGFVYSLHEIYPVKQ